MSREMKTVTKAEFIAMLDLQGMTRDNLAFRCPMCGTIQSISDFKSARPDLTEDYILGQIGFGCIGRQLQAGPPRKEKDGKPCNWSLGGLFQVHKLEVVAPDGTHHPYFEPVSREEAQAHLAAKAGAV